MKRILSLILTIALLCASFPAAADDPPLEPLSQAEIQAARAMIAMDAQSAGWQEGDAVNAGMNALQVQQYLTWLLAGDVDGLVRRIKDSQSMCQSTIVYAMIEKQVQWLRREIAANRDEVEEKRRSIYADLQRLDGATEHEKLKIAVRVRADMARLEAIRTATAGSAYADVLKDRTDEWNALDKSDYTLATPAPEAQQLTREESGTYDVRALSGMQFGFVVRDAQGNPISDATVSVACPADANGTSVGTTTDANGLAVFWVKDFQPDGQGRVTVNVVIQKNGYCTREMRRARLRGGMAESIRLEPYADTPFLRMVSYNQSDILSQTKTLFYTPKNGANQRIDVLVDDLGGQKNGTLTLCYQTLGADGALQDREEAAAFTTGTVVTFSAPYARLIAPGTTVSIRVETQGFANTFDTQLTSKKAVVDEPVYRDADVKAFSGSVELKIPDEVPFLGGQTLSLAIPGVKGQLVIDPTGFAQFAYGKRFEAEEQNWRQESELDVQRRADEADKQNRREANVAAQQVYRTAGAAGDMALFGGAQAVVNVLGGMVGRIDADAAQLKLEGVGGLLAAFKRGYEGQFTVLDDMPLLTGMEMAFALGKTFALGLEADWPALSRAQFLFNRGQGAAVEIQPELGVTTGTALRSLVSPVLSFDGGLLIKMLLTSPKSATAALDMVLAVTAQTFLTQWTQNLWESIPDSLSGVTKPGQRATNIAASGNNTAPSSPRTIPHDEGLMAETETEVFSRIDTLAQDIQYATLISSGKKAHFAFFITPVVKAGQARKAELVWYNLDDPTVHGVVYATSNGDDWRGKTASDYAFAVDAHNDYVAFNILSGTFEGENEKPTESRMALAVMQLDSDGKNLLLKNYSTDDTKLPKSESGNVLTMPIVYVADQRTSESRDQRWKLNAACNVEKAESGETVSVKSIDLQASVSTGIIPTITTTKIELSDPVADTAKDIGAGVTRRLATAVPNGSLDSESGRKSLSSYYRLYAADEEAGGALQLSVNGTTYALDDDVIFMAPLSAHGTNNNSDELLFYTKRGQAGDGSDCYRLMGAQRKSDFDREKITIRDYDVPMYAEHFQIVTLNDGSAYGHTLLYWVESASDGKGKGTIYRVKGVRFDRESNAMTAPFTLVELSQRPTSVYIGTDGTGYYTCTTDRIVIQSARSGESTALSQSLYTFKLIFKADLALTGAAANDPCLSAGDYAEMLISVKNTGSLPISSFGVNLMKQGTTFQTVSVNCENPQTASVNSLFGDAATSANSVARVDSVFDDDNGDMWVISSQDWSTGNVTNEDIHTGLLMPGGVHVYRIVFRVPEDWDGGTNLTAQITNLSATTGGTSDSTGRISFETNGMRTDQDTDSYTMGSITVKRAKYDDAQNTRAVEIGREDLMLDCQPYVAPNGQEYVRVNIVARSQTKGANPPTLTATLDGQTVLTHPFKNAINADFGYTLDIPAARLLNGRMSGDVTFTVADSRKGLDSDFAPFDNARTVTLGRELLIIEHPQDVTTLAGSDASFTVAASGGRQPYTYQWQQQDEKGNWVNITGANEAQLKLSAVTMKMDGMRVRCVVRDFVGSEVVSNPAKLTVGEPLTIIEHPQDVTTLAGSDASFTVAASGGRQPYTYQWQKQDEKGNWVNLTGANEAELKLFAVTMKMDGMRVRCVVRDFGGSEVVSDIAKLVVEEPLIIVEHPQDVTTLVGANVSFKVAASGGRQPYAYQWQQQDEKGNWVNITGANEAELKLSAVTMKMDGMKVRCVVRDFSGSEVVSDIAKLVVWQPLPQTGDTQRPLTFALTLAAALLALGAMRKGKKRKA